MTTINVGNNLGDFRIELVETEGRFTVTIDSYNGDSKEVVVPDNIGGIPVTVIGDMAFFGNKSLTNVILPESLVTIEYSAFDSCKNLSCINLPEGLIEIESDAFKDCASLADIKLPESLVEIESWAFQNCTSLVNVKLPQSLVSIGIGAFENCEKLSKITIPKNTVHIATSAFDDCNNLKEITVDEQNPYFSSKDGVLFDKNLTTLIFYPQAKKGDYAIPDSVNTIASCAFSNNTRGLTGLNFPKDILDIYSFNNCEQLANFTVNENSKYFYSKDGILFEKDKEGKVEGLICYPQGKKNANYVVPDFVWWIRFRAFYNCKNLTNIILPEGLEHIGENVFYGCEGLSELTLPMSLEYIAEGAFRECPNLKTITLSRNTKMGHKALDGFSGELIYRD